MRFELSRDYGVGEVVVVVVSVVLLSVVAGVIVAIGVSMGVIVAIGVVSIEVVGEGFTMVVLVSSPGEAPGAAVSVFCSHAARSAALARMQMYFFIGCG